MLKYNFILTLLICSCSPIGRKQKKNSDNCIKDYQLLKGTWQSLDFWDSYTEIEISDSLRCYVNHGEYVGPTRAEKYFVKNDTLIRVKTGQKYRICISNCNQVLLKNELGQTFEWKRFKSSFKISDWTLEKDSLFNQMFLLREREFEK